MNGRLLMGVPKSTEMTIRDVLQQELRKRGVTVVPEFSVSTPAGVLKPDILLRNGAPYVVETKLGVETKLLEAMVKLYDYQKYVTEAKGAFAVLFPEELRQPWSHDVILNIAMNPQTKYVVAAIFKDLRPSQRFAGSLSEVADWMASHVLRAPVVEADTGFAIRVLRDAVSYIAANVRQLQGKELEDIFGGKTVFENILQYEEGRYPLEEMRQAATYLLVNQLLFYHVLSRMDASFPAVDEEKIGKPADLAQYFGPVLKRDYSSIFGFDVASRLPDSAAEVVKKVVVVVKALAPEKIRQDLLGKVFHELIPFQIRKAVAAFYTNNEAADILAQLAIDKPDAKVMDLAVGSGTLLVAAYRRKRELLQKFKGTIELEDHKRFLESDLTGIDIMPFAAHLAVVHLSLQALLFETEKVRVAVWDSTELKPGMNIPAIRSELKTAYRRPTIDMFGEKFEIPKEAYIKKGAITMEGIGGESIPLEKTDVVIMNPPFTRQERLPKRYKDALYSRLREYEDQLSGRLGLYGYFVLLADKFLKPNGKLAFVLPATVLRIDSTRGIRDFLTKHYEFEHIITTYQKAAFSEGAQFREILLIARKTPKSDGRYCLVTFLRKLPESTTAAKGLSEKLRELQEQLTPNETYVSNELTAKKISQMELRQNAANLFKIIASEDPRVSDLWNKVKERASDKLTLFSEVLTKHGGNIEEGARARSHLIRAPIGATFIVCDPERAAKRNDMWLVKGVTKDVLTAENLIGHNTISVPLKSLQYGLRRFSGVGSIDLTGNLDYIVVKEFPQIEDFFSRQNVQDILKDLPQWKEYINKRLSKLVVADRFDMSASGTALFAWYSKIPMAGYSLVLNVTGLDDEYAKILALWFNTTVNALQFYLKRIETRGAWMAFRKYVMSAMDVLDLENLSEDQREALLRTFDDLKDVEFPSFLKQLRTSFPARVKIDKLMLRIFGFGDDEISRILDYLYPALVNEIEQLKTLMQG